MITRRRELIVILLKARSVQSVAAVKRGARNFNEDLDTVAICVTAEESSAVHARAADAPWK